MELHQLRRENVFLRRKLEKNKSKNEAELARKFNRVRTAKDEPRLDDSAVANLLREVEVMRDCFGLLYARTLDFRVSRVLPARPELETLVSDGLAEVAAAEENERYGRLLTLFESVICERQEWETRTEEVLEDLADYLRRLNGLFVQKATRIKKTHDRLAQKTKVLRMLREQVRFEAAQGLKDLRRLLERTAETLAARTAD